MEVTRELREPLELIRIHLMTRGISRKAAKDTVIIDPFYLIFRFIHSYNTFSDLSNYNTNFNSLIDYVIQSARYLEEIGFNKDYEYDVRAKVDTVKFSQLWKNIDKFRNLVSDSIRNTKQTIPYIKRKVYMFIFDN